jgi:hypothetical protein
MDRSTSWRGRGSPDGAEERADFAGELFWLLECGEVATEPGQPFSRASHLYQSRAAVSGQMVQLIG